MTMKRRGTNNKQVMEIQKPSPERPDSGTAIVAKTREQLIAELSVLTGTQSAIKAIASIKEMAPQNAEAMLAAQMIATNEAALLFARRSTQDQHLAVVEASVLHSTRFMRLFIQQIEAMQKLKGRASQPNLVVEHVDVHQGGQAIVGSVNTLKEGK